MYIKRNEYNKVNSKNYQYMKGYNPIFNDKEQMIRTIILRGSNQVIKEVNEEFLELRVTAI